MNRLSVIGMIVTAGVLLTLPLLIACGGSSDALELDIPEDVRMEVEAGAPEEQYVFYALKESPPTSWEDFKNKGLWIGRERPPLISEELKATIDGGGFLPGTVLTITADSGVFKSTEGMNIIVTIGITFEGSIKAAIDQMEQSPGLILLTKRDADFNGKEEMVEVSFR